MSLSVSKRFAAALATLLLAVGAAALAPAASNAETASDSASPAAAARLDDRDLKKSKGKKRWTKVSSRKAYKRTLSRTRKANATAVTKRAATNGGSVTFQAGPGRGRFVVTVGSKRRKVVKTVGKSVKLKTVAFRGAGLVKLKITRPGRRGVYLDAVRLAGKPSQAPPVRTAPPATICPAGTSDGGTLNSARGTPLRVCRLPGRVASNMVLQRLENVVYSLAGPVEVGSDVGGSGTLAGGSAVTLTVERGVVVVADGPGDWLLVNRGSRIVAVGTAAEPIVFTSRSNLAGTAAETANGLWGGITLLGRAPISDCNAAVPGGSAGCQQTLPNFTASYGGGIPTDTSGTLSHVQIRFAGAATGTAIGVGSEGAGLRAAGVGNATVLDHIQVHGSAGDGLSLIGGRASLRSVALTGAVDDLLDTDYGYRGTIQHLLGAQSGADSGDALIEADSNGNEDALPRQYTRISNATLIGRSTVANRISMLLRGGTDFALLNSLVTGTLNCIDIDSTGGTTTRAADAGLQDVGAPVFRSVRLDCPTAFADDGNTTAAAIATIFGSGTNNNSSAHVTSLAGLVNGPNEAAVGATDPTAFNGDVFGSPAAGPNVLGTTTHIGAIPSTADARFRGWACDSSFASFGSGVSCTASPL